LQNISSLIGMHAGCGMKHHTVNLFSSQFSICKTTFIMTHFEPSFFILVCWISQILYLKFVSFWSQLKSPRNYGN